MTTLREKAVIAAQVTHADNYITECEIQAAHRVMDLVEPILLEMYDIIREEYGFDSPTTLEFKEKLGI